MKKLNTLQDYLDFFKEADELYYSKGISKYPDDYYDKIKDEFLEKYPDHEYKKNVGHIESIKGKIKHKILMGSQKKINTFDELIKWIESNDKKIGTVNEYVYSEKLDGLSVSLEYNKGSFVQAVLRGDGEFGDDVTSNVLKIKTFPKKIKYQDHIFIRGELILKKKNFELINNSLEDKMSNPRNAVSGIVRRLDGKNSEEIDFLAYDFSLELNEIEKFLFLKDQGFETPKYGLLKDSQEIQKKWEDYEKSAREKSEYELDGLIITINNKEKQNELGIIDNRPRYSRAYKFTSLNVLTEIEEINWFVGRTGRITPVAKVKPVSVGGVVVSNVTLHNVKEVIKNNLTINTHIEIKRAGDVIPKFERVISKGKGKVIYPKKCPSCNKETKLEDTFLMCYNKECKVQKYEKLLNWVKTLEIKGFGEEIVNQLFEKEKIKTFSDYYLLTEKDLIEMDRMGSKLAQKILKELNDKKEISFGKFIKGIGINNIGEKTADLLGEKYTIETLLNLKDFNELLSIDGIGEITARSVLEIQNEEKEIKKLLKHIKIIKNEVKGNKFQNQNFCFTGFRNKTLENYIKDNGGKIVSSVSKNLNYLLVADYEMSSSKIETAKKLNLNILTESDFIKNNQIILDNNN